KGIRVNAVAPGPIWTPIQPSKGQPQEKLPYFGQDTPLGRAGQPAEIAPAFVFLTSPESSYVIGETLHVNGGTPTPYTSRQNYQFYRAYSDRHWLSPCVFVFCRFSPLLLVVGA